MFEKMKEYIEKNADAELAHKISNAPMLTEGIMRLLVGFVESERRASLIEFTNRVIIGKNKINKNESDNIKVSSSFLEEIDGLG